jgi:uncharacterized protein (DUF433 family)
LVFELTLCARLPPSEIAASAKKILPPHFRVLGSVDSGFFPGQFAGVKKKPAKVGETAAAYAARSPGRDWERHIVLDPAVLTGKPIVKGTRLAVEFVLGLLAQGWSGGEIRRNYPGLTQVQILACVAYAQARLSEEKVVHSRIRTEKLELDADEIDLHAAVSAAAMRDLGR